MSEPFDQLELGTLFHISKGSVCPFLFPDEEFVHHSLPAFDATGGPAIEFGRQIESNKTLLGEPVVLVSKLNPRTCRVTVVDPSNSQRRHCCSTEFIAFAANEEELSLSYYMYLFEAEAFRALLQNTAIGTTNSHVRARPTDTLRWKIPRPPWLEQRKIAEILSTVDRAIEETEVLIAKQQRIKTGLTQDLLTRGIDEHGNLRSEATHEFRDSLLGRIPKEWDVKQLDWVATDIVDCPHTTPTFQSEGILVARTFNLKNGCFVGERSWVSHKDYANRVSRLEPRNGDVIFTREAPVGEAFIIPKGLKICLGQRTMLIRCDAKRCLPEYLLEVVYGEEMRIRFDQMVGGTTNPHLNVGDVRSLSIRRAPLGEQATIAERIQGIRRVLERNLKQQEKLLALKSALMQDLITGKKRVTPLLEPALIY